MQTLAQQSEQQRVEQIKEKLTTSASCLNITPAMPFINMRGKNTTIVVRVLAVTAAVTSCVPFSAALSPSAFFSLNL